ncbi:hypothetical protein JTE90_028612 [Oedothorax gibbosus]|uniref:Reverse transcriptase n=1 Tax=Oedothorax gibbosus TaxID=931172 RepID=A0AAV6TZ82_9ARAC|nr:hypothetical protein JTE90_028612 [Oedothorax gibbosus]
MKETLYMHQPDGFDDGTSRLCLLKKCIYGLKQAPKNWFTKFSVFMNEIGFESLETDPYIFHRSTFSYNKCYPFDPLPLSHSAVPTGISPSGRISCISDLFGGAISDKEIFKRSVLPKVLEKGDVVLADKGFKIEEELNEIGVGLMQPLFLQNKIQFTERVENKVVSNLRVHVERAISRIKNFKYLILRVLYRTIPSTTLMKCFTLRHFSQISTGL